MQLRKRYISAGFLASIVLLYLLLAGQTVTSLSGPPSSRLLHSTPTTHTLVLRTRVVNGGAGASTTTATLPLPLVAASQALPPHPAPALPQAAAAPALPAPAAAAAAAPQPAAAAPQPAAAAAAPASSSLYAATVSSPKPLRPVSELLPELHPLYPYASTQPFTVTLATPWFQGDMPYFRGAHTCPASGCRLTLDRSSQATADMVLYHLRPADFAGVPAPPAKGGRQLVGLMLAEGFEAASLPEELFTHFNSEHSFRPSSLVRDSYILWFLNDAHKQGIEAPQRPFSLGARTWAEVWEPPLPLPQRSATHVASWGSHYCRGSRSGREDLVRALAAAGLPIAILGEEGNCLRNVEAGVLALDRPAQFRLLRSHKFYLAFENHRLEGYVSEKFYWALLRGQVPVVWGAPDIARHAPGPGSYIDASAFPTPAALAQHLLALAADDAAYASYHAWRTERSFEDYGDVLRQELVEMLWVGSKSMEPADWYACRMCHALERYRAGGGLDRVPPMGIPSIKSSEAPAFTGTLGG